MAIVSQKMINKLTYKELCVLCCIMDNNGKLDKVREDFKDILTRDQLTRVFKTLKDKGFIVRYHNPNYVEYKQVRGNVFHTNAEIIKRKGLTWKARFVLAGIYESFSDRLGIFVLTYDILKRFNCDREFRRTIKKYASRDSDFLEKASKPQSYVFMEKFNAAVKKNTAN